MKSVARWEFIFNTISLVTSEIILINVTDYGHLSEQLLLPCQFFPLPLLILEVE